MRMHGRPKSVFARRLFATFIVCVVHAVPGFTQTNTTDRLRTSATVAATYVASRSAAYDNVALPPNLHVPPAYTDLLEAMLARSATFRRQCARIARATGLSVTLSPEILPPAKRALAMTEISRASNGAMHATIRISSYKRAAELLAHEIEHIIEQLDGVNLATMSRVTSSGVRRCDCSGAEAFETTRAITMGAKVAEEMLQRSP
jgi:hypothetical protein